jgi:hypothetical protein
MLGWPPPPLFLVLHLSLCLFPLYASNVVLRNNDVTFATTIHCKVAVYLLGAVGAWSLLVCSTPTHTVGRRSAIWQKYWGDHSL